MEVDNKKMKLDSDVPEVACKHYVKRKKRFCKMTVAKGMEYCGEHIPPKVENVEIDDGDRNNRIVCPLDSKHSVYKRNLKKHLKICNAREQEQPTYIQVGVNSGSDDEEDTNGYQTLRLSDLTNEKFDNLVNRVEKLFEKDVNGQIEELFLSHDILEEELNNKEYGQETKKHLIQTAAILGLLKHFNFLSDNTSYIEFGAGKGQVSYWLANVLQNWKSSNIILLDRASLRHKKDNKLEDKSSIHRIRCDIADFVLDNLNFLNESNQVIGVSKHLCGAATDLTIRCLLKKCTKTNASKTKSFIIAVCCHHRCEWKSFVGKKYLLTNGFSKQDFVLITKMASYAICGSGFSRERNKHSDVDKNQLKTQINSNNNKLTLGRREQIGKMCKRILDQSRVAFLKEHGFDCQLKYYVKNSVTLENVCIIATNNKQ